MEAISPFFIVSDVERSIAFYRDVLGLEERFREPAAGNGAPFFAIVGRGGVQLLLKSDPAVAPLPNPKRHPSMRWDAFVYVSNPDDLTTELSSRGAHFTAPLKDTHDGLRGFELSDPDGHILFFGRPRP